MRVTKMCVLNCTVVLPCSVKSLVILPKFTIMNVMNVMFHVAIIFKYGVPKIYVIYLVIFGTILCFKQMLLLSLFLFPQTIYFNLQLF